MSATTGTSSSSSSELRRRNIQQQQQQEVSATKVVKNDTDDESDEEEKPPTRQLSPMEVAQEKYRKFFTRSIWGTIMILVFGAILWMGHAAISLFVLLLQIMVFKEMLAVRYSEAKERKLWGFRTLHWYFLLGTLFFVYGPTFLDVSSKILQDTHTAVDLAYLHRSHLLISFILYVVGFIAFIVTLKKGSLKYQFSQLTWTLMILLIVIGQSNFIIQNAFKGLFWFLFPCSLIICNDIMAYMCGIVAGRKFIDRPLTKLSPNKTWEGFIGALFCTLIWAFVFSKFLAQYEWFICPKELSYNDLFYPQGSHCVPHPIFSPKEYQLPVPVIEVLSKVDIHQTAVTLLPVQLHALIFALFASLIAPFGGFFASGIKRAYQKKDFDTLFPGHGGVTDRMDCQFIMGFFAYIYYSVFISPVTMDVTHILIAISTLPHADQVAILKHLNHTIGTSL